MRGESLIVVALTLSNAGALVVIVAEGAAQWAGVALCGLGFMLALISTMRWI